MKHRPHDCLSLHKPGQIAQWRRPKTFGSFRKASAKKRKPYTPYQVLPYRIYDAETHNHLPNYHIIRPTTASSSDVNGSQPTLSYAGMCHYCWNISKLHERALPGTRGCVRYTKHGAIAMLLSEYGLAQSPQTRRQIRYKLTYEDGTIDQKCKPSPTQPALFARF